MNAERNGLCLAWILLRRGVARCSCIAAVFLTLTDPAPGARIASNMERVCGNARYRVALLARVKPSVTKPGDHQDATARRNASGDDYLADAARLRSEWREASLRLAVQKYQSAAAQFKEADDKVGEAKALLGTGEVLALLGEQDKALVQYRRALPLVSAANAVRFAIDVLNRLAEVEIEKTVPTGETYARRALGLAEHEGYKAGQAGALKNLGIIAYIRHNHSQALDLLNRALALWQSEGELAGQAEALTNLGFTYGDSGDVNRALECFDKALDLARAARNPQREAQVALAIGLVHTMRGEWQKALDQYETTTLILNQIGDKAGQALALNGMGYLYGELGEADQSLESFTKSLSLSRQMSHRNREALTLSHIADIYAETGRRPEALRIYKGLVLLGRAIRDAKTEAYAVNNAGAVYESMGRIERALRCYQRALTIARSLNHPRVQAYSLDHLGTLNRQMHRLREARAQYQAAASLMRQAGDQAGETLVSYHIARLLQAEGKTDDALRDARNVIQAVESLRSDVASPDLRTSYLATVYGSYELLIDLLMQKNRQEPASGYDVAAFEECEFGRARSLSEMLTEARANIREGVRPDLLERERAVATQLAKKADEEMALREVRFKLENSKSAKGAVRAEELRDNNRSLEAAGREITDLTGQLDKATAEITASSLKKYTALLRPKRVSLKQLQDEVLDSDTLLLEYSLGEERSYLWIIGRGSLNSYVLPSKAEIEQKANRFYQALTSISTNGKGANTSRRARSNVKAFDAARELLSRTLLAPIAASLGKKRLLIVPDGALQYVPFAALIDPNTKEPLVVTHELAAAPSLSVVLEMRAEMSTRTTPLKTLAVIADPVIEEQDPRLRDRRTVTEPPLARAPVKPRGASILESTREPFAGASGADSAINFVRLVFAAEEADAIAALLPEGERVVWRDFDANRQRVTSGELNNFRIVHFATHGLLDFRRPKLSCLLLSRFDRGGKPQDGSLRLQDVYNLKLSADLVVLSACQTALGKQIRGEGLVGLTRGFMYAGARRVVASLWNVDDSATAKLMERFYRKMLGAEKLAPAAALRASQVEMMRERRWQDPYFWASFVLQGDWK